MRVIAPFIDYGESEPPEWAMSALSDWLNLGLMPARGFVLATDPDANIVAQRLESDGKDPEQFKRWLSMARPGVDVPLVWREGDAWGRCMFTTLPQTLKDAPNLEATPVLSAV